MPPKARQQHRTPAEALDALTVLGFNRAVALDALRGIDIENTELEDVIREALKKLMK